MHRQNTMDRVPLQPGGNGARQIVAGEPFDEQLVGPSSAAWGRRPGDYGRIAYITTDGGLIAPPTDDIVRPARLLRAELPAADTAGPCPRRQPAGVVARCRGRDREVASLRVRPAWLFVLRPA